MSKILRAGVVRANAVEFVSLFKNGTIKADEAYSLAKMIGYPAILKSDLDRRIQGARELAFGPAKDAILAGGSSPEAVVGAYMAQVMKELDDRANETLGDEAESIRRATFALAVSESACLVPGWNDGAHEYDEIRKDFVSGAQRATDNDVVTEYLKNIGYYIEKDRDMNANTLFAAFATNKAFRTQLLQAECLQDAVVKYDGRVHYVVPVMA